MKPPQLAAAGFGPCENKKEKIQFMKNYRTKGILCILGGMINIGISFLVMNLMGVLTYPLAEKFGVDYSRIAIIWTALSIGAIITSLILSRLLERFNPKFVCALAPISYILGISLLPILPNVTSLIAVYALVGFLNGMGSTLPFFMLSQQWVGAGRGSIVGLGSLFSAIFTTIFTPIITNITYTAGFEVTCIWTGIILAAVQVVVTLICICRLPSYYGAEPIDIPFLAKREKADGQDSAVYETKMPLSKILTTGAFWMTMITIVAVSLAQNAFYSNRAAVFGEMGVDLNQIALLAGVWTIADLAVRWLFGFMSDKLGFKVPLILFLLLAVITWVVYPGIFALGMTGGILFSVLGNIGQVSQVFGTNVLLPMYGVNKANTLTGWANIGASVGSLLAPVVVALSASYGQMAIMLAVLYAIGFVLSLIITSKRAAEGIRETDRKWEAAHGTAKGTKEVR